MDGISMTRLLRSLNESDEEDPSSSSEKLYPDPEYLSTYQWRMRVTQSGYTMNRDGTGTPYTPSKTYKQGQYRFP